MTCRIETWNKETRVGTLRTFSSEKRQMVRLTFGPEALDEHAQYFREEEEVDVEIEEGKVRRVLKKSFRAPNEVPGTELEAFTELNAEKNDDLHIEDWSDKALKLWIGYCCPQCSHSANVTFHRPSLVEGFRGDYDMEDPHFRLATDDEIGQHQVPKGERAYFIVGTESNPTIKPGVLVIAPSVSIEWCTPKTETKSK